MRLQGRGLLSPAQPCSTGTLAVGERWCPGQERVTKRPTRGSSQWASRGWPGAAGAMGASGASGGQRGQREASGASGGRQAYTDPPWEADAESQQEAGVWK